MKKFIYVLILSFLGLTFGSCEKEKNDVAGKTYQYSSTEYGVVTSTFYFDKKGKTCDWNYYYGGQNHWSKDISYTMSGSTINVGSVKTFTYHVDYIEDTDGWKYYKQ